MSETKILESKVERARRAFAEARRINDPRMDEYVGRVYAAWEQDELAKRAMGLRS
jgi:hypothetical protein